MNFPPRHGHLVRVISSGLVILCFAQLSIRAYTKQDGVQTSFLAGATHFSHLVRLIRTSIRCNPP